MRLSYFSFLLLVLFTACLPDTTQDTFTSRGEDVRILFLNDKANIQWEEQLMQGTLKGDWKVTKATDNYQFTEDSLGSISAILTSFSALNKLDHRAINSLKRYLEAGGGGVVAIKDTLNAQTGWPWLSNWNNRKTDQELKQDAANLMILKPNFTSQDLQKALKYAIGKNTLPDYDHASTPKVPEESRYSYHVLSQGLDEPMQMAILPDHNVLFVERKGAIKLYDHKTNKTRTIAHIEVFSGIEDGLLGVAIDPDFEQNNWLYLYYAVAGEKAINRLSRMELREDQLLTASEKVVLEIPTQREYCCHAAGYLFFGPGGLLYLSTGDNTNAEETEGYIPIDERAGRQLADDQATAANSNDLRGKILRIKPEPDGSYSIPEGNLFPEGMPKTRPEIYTMGNRNPYRFSVDMKNGFVYWGDIGPDTKVPSSEGTLSFDEINQAREPGFFGWPYFLGKNEAFPDYDFATKQEGLKFNPLKPANNSPNNTGISDLPPAQPAMIWYGDGISEAFPLVGKGGESAMAGPVYYADLFADAPFKLPAYYDGKLFIYDWVRRWFMAVTFDENTDYLRMEPFLDHMAFAAPTDMQFASDGSIYILEYGTNWFAKNTDARLIRVEYAEGNRKPVANIQADKLYGASPLTVMLSAADSKDFDADDHLQYSWLIEGREVRGAEVSHTFDQAGAYDVVLTVTDKQGATDASALEIKAGNAPPVVSISTRANQSFYWDDLQLDYQIEVSDPEDEPVDPEQVRVTFDFLPQGKDVAVALTSSQSSANTSHTKGRYLLNKLDCKACHSIKEQSVGPDYTAIAERYSGKPGVADKLVDKIIEGGNGSWGKRSMSSHPDLSRDDAAEIVKYILSLNEPDKLLPLQGLLSLNAHSGKGHEGSYLLVAQYTDKGANQMDPLSGRSHLVLRNPLVQIEDHDEGNVHLGTITTEFLTFASGIRHGSFVKFNQLDLSHIAEIRYRLQQNGAGGNIEVRLNSQDGPLISSLSIAAGREEDLKKGWKEVSAPLKETKGVHDVFFVFTNKKVPEAPLFNIDWLYFSHKNKKKRNP